MHPPSAARRTVTIKREVIQVETVLGDRRDSRGHWDYMLDHDKRIGYIRIDAFSRDTFRDLRAAMKELDKQKLRGLIVDLRFNPGGLLASAIEVADLFLSEGEIVSTSGRNSKKRSWSARKPDTFEGFPMAVLVNRYSASASEIVSASLQDHKRAIVIGERTWGKGSVQNVIDLEEGKSALKLTTASYKRPSGHNIHRFPDSKESDEWGVMPDPGYEIKLNDEELNRLVALRFERKILLPNASTPQDESPAADKPADEPKKPSGPSDDTKSEETKSDAVKPDPAKPDPAKPDAEKTKPSEDETPKADAKPADAAAASSDAQPQTADRQLQKAIDYLTGELAKAGERSSANLAK
jgi:carboxyl-terminal processing protease